MEVSTGIVAILLMVTGMVLCLTLTFAVLKIVPSIRRNLDNMEEATRNLAEATRNLPETAGNVKEISKNLLSVIKDVSNATPIPKVDRTCQQCRRRSLGPSSQQRTFGRPDHQELV